MRPTPNLSSMSNDQLTKQYDYLTRAQAKGGDSEDVIYFLNAVTAEIQRRKQPKIFFNLRVSPFFARKSLANKS